ncbi:MAG TPA: metal ABC transporter substrate-binding protein, partial [Candidatus Limnocylindrales bacterium]|nr:metal ABC transporter substrate-binding protein [Candidatus Limnocylindrales bacterium]
VLADLVANVGGDRVTVSSVVPKGGEVHTFDPSPQDVVGLTEADLIVSNGLGLDEWLTDLAADSGADARIVELGEDLGIDYLAGDEHEDETDTDHGTVNPHLWLDVANARLYVAKLADALAAADPDGMADYRANAQAYDAELADLDAWIRDQIGTIAPADRALVSFHEAFPYLARAYGLEIVGVVVNAPGQDPSAGEIAALVAAIRAAGVKAVFGEAQFSDKLVRTIAEETGATVETNLYNDSLGDPPADSYLGMMRWNVERIVAALGGDG